MWPQLGFLPVLRCLPTIGVFREVHIYGIVSGNEVDRKFGQYLGCHFYQENWNTTRSALHVSFFLALKMIIHNKLEYI